MYAIRSYYVKCNFVADSVENMERRDIEIMAPVGSYESLAAAIQAGAGSVYFGVEGLNMRPRSSNNFTLDDLRTIAERRNNFV